MGGHPAGPRLESAATSATLPQRHAPRESRRAARRTPRPRPHDDACTAAACSPGGFRPGREPPMTIDDCSLSAPAAEDHALPAYICAPEPLGEATRRVDRPSPAVIPMYTMTTPLGRRLLRAREIGDVAGRMLGPEAADLYLSANQRAILALTTPSMAHVP